jgi:general secretion pathway protein G
MSHRNSPRRARRAFTLMELLLVMAILVILLGLVAPRFIGTQKKANENAAKIQIEMFADPLKTYVLDMNTFPTTEQGLKSLIEAPADLENPKKWRGYLDADEIPKDPWGHDYQYAYPPTHNKRDFPDIWSLGPDGEDGTEDDIGNWTTEESEEGAQSSA